MIEIEIRGGITGIGITWAPASVVQALVECPDTGLGRFLIGEDLSDARAILRTIHARWQAERGRGGNGDGVLINAIAAVELAIWDALGKASEMALHELLGGAGISRMNVYASASAFDEALFSQCGELRHRSDAQLVEIVSRCVAAGFRSLKFGWGNRHSESDFATLAAIRDALGPDRNLMLDFGCPAYLDKTWTVKRAIDIGTRLFDAGIEFWEEPLQPDDFDGFLRLTRNCPLKIATGESLTRLDDFFRLIDTGAVDVIQPDIVQIGVERFMRVAQRAREAGIECAPHGPWSAIAVAGHAHALSVVSPESKIEFPAHLTSPSRSPRDELLAFTHRRLTSTSLIVRDGYLDLPESPGLGIGNWVDDETRAFCEFLENGGSQ